MHRDFCRPQKGWQTAVHESAREHGCKELPRRQFQSRVCLFAEVAPQPSANKEQRLRIYESENFRSSLSRLGRNSVSELLNVVSALLQQRDESIRSAHVRRAGDNKVSLATVKVIFDPRHPITIPLVE